MKEIKLNLYCIRVPRFWIYMTHVFLPLCNYIIKNNTSDTHFILQFPRKCIFHSFFTEVFDNITINIKKKKKEKKKISRNMIISNHGIQLDQFTIKIFYLLYLI